MKENIPKACTEMTEIFQHMSKDVLERIPEGVRRNIKMNRDKTYVFRYDPNKELNDQELLPETRGMIAEIYRDYVASEEERKIWEREHIKYCSKKKLKQYKALKEKEGGQDVQGDC